MSQFSPAALSFVLLCAFSSQATTFLSAPSYATGKSPTAVVVADFNGDGKLDVAVANKGDGNVGVFLGNGDGTFRAAVNYGAGTSPRSIVVGDFNGDGRVDLAVANETSGNVSILIGNGDGTFLAAVNYSAGNTPQAVASGDFNGDGKVDLVVGNINKDSSGNRISVLMGNGDGTFRAYVAYASAAPLSLAVGDMNGDGLLDLVISDALGTIQVLLGKSGGIFGGVISSSSFQNITAIALKDFDRDGKLDVAWGLSVQFGNGDGTVGPVVTLGSADAGSGIVSADMNGDGKLDLVTTGSRAAHTSVVLGNGDGTFARAVSYLTQDEPKGVAVGDFNGDGTPDIVVTNQNSKSITIFLGNPSGTYQGTAQYGGSDAVSAALTMGDFNRDGKIDMAVAVSGSFGNVPQVFAYPGNGDGSFQQAASYQTSGSGALAVTSADFSGDGILDLAETNACPNLGCSGDGVLNILLGNADGSFEPTVAYSALTEPFSVSAADLNHDGVLDVLVAQPSGNLGIFAGLGGGAFRTEVNFGAGGDSLALSLADLNHDGNVDAITANECTGDRNGCHQDGSVSVLLGNPNGTFKTPVTYSAGGNPNSVAVGDFNGDGKLDLAVASSAVTGFTDGGLDVLLANGDGTFGTAVAYDAGADTDAVAVADINGDGKLDLAVTNTLGTDATVSVLLGKGDGTFQTKTHYPTGRFPTFIAAADLNGDGAPDVETAGTDGATILLNAGGTRVTTTSTPNPSTLQQAVAFTATVSASVSGVTVVPTGSVTFLDGSTQLGSATLANGQAVFTTSSLSPGARSISAAYSGDAQFNPHNAAPITQTVLSPVVNLNPTSLNFGNQQVGTTSAGKNVKLTNRGQGTLNITSISASAGFSQTNNCGTSLGSNQSCTITVKFSPTATGTQNGTVSIIDNAHGSPHKVALSGVGI